MWGRIFRGFRRVSGNRSLGAKSGVGFSNWTVSGTHRDSGRGEGTRVGVTGVWTDYTRYKSWKQELLEDGYREEGSKHTSTEEEK